MKDIVFATSNEHKLREIRQILENSKYRVLSMKEKGVKLDVVENGTTFEENALIKARALWNEIGGIVVADDSGLVIDYLNGEPGVYSARYMGENTDYKIKNTAIIDRMKDAKAGERSARFVAVLVCILENGKEIIVKDTMEGVISEYIDGENGFGYDPILYLPEFNCTSAGLSDEEKNRISHRGKALRKVREILDNENFGA